MPTKEEADEVLRVTKLMETMNKSLEGIGDMRKRFNEVLEAVGSRMDALEKKIEGIQTGGVVADTSPMEERLDSIEKGIEMIEEALEKMETKEHTHKDLQESIENAVNYTEKVEKTAEEAKKTSFEDNKFISGMYEELKSHITDTEERLREMNKNVAKASRDNEKTGKFRLALKGFLQAVLED